MTEEKIEGVEAESAVEPVESAEPEVAAEPEPEPEPEPEGPGIEKVRQWVTLRGSSMDHRTGWGNRADMAHDLRSVLGRPHLCALVHEPGTPADLVEFFRMDLMAEGFEVAVAEVADVSCSLDAATAFDGVLAEAGVTSDDLVVAVGGTDLLSVAAFACADWCGGVSLAIVPLSLSAALTAGVTPRPLDLGDRPRMIMHDGSARFQISDLELFDLDPASEDVKLALAHMVVSAIDDTDKALGKVWDAADALTAGDPVALAQALTDGVKSRGRIISSSALATRQSIEYGTSFAYALETLVGPDVPRSSMLADGLRFAARLSVAQEVLSIDDMFTQDELLEKLQLGTVEVEVDPDALVDALKAERFARSRRFMIALPRAIGRVRLATIEDDLLREHAAAWCAAR